MKILFSLTLLAMAAGVLIKLVLLLKEPRFTVKTLERDELRYTLDEFESVFMSYLRHQLRTTTSLSRKEASVQGAYDCAAIFAHLLKQSKATTANDDEVDDDEVDSDEVDSDEVDSDEVDSDEVDSDGNECHDGKKGLYLAVNNVAPRPSGTWVEEISADPD